MSVFRRLLIVGVVVVAVACGGAAAAATLVWNRAQVSTAGDVEFVNPLAVPPLAPSEMDAEGRRVFDLTVAEGSHDFGRAEPTPTWGFSAACGSGGGACEGGYLGPTLRAARGEEVLVNVRNALPEQTSVHWHGMHLPAAMDGGPHRPIAPGRTWSPTWRVDQPAATLWYHPHPHGVTADHVYRGLAGMFIVDDPAAAALGLPDEYGVDDIPVIVQDKRFTGDGRLDDRQGVSGIGVLGDTIAVNGTVAPYLDVTTERVRLRLLNGSNARTYEFGFADGRRFTLVGTDGGLLDRPYEMSRVLLSPGERAEIVVTVAPGERTVLRSFPPSLGVSFWRRFLGGDDTFDVLQLRAADTLAASPAVPGRLVDLPRIDPAGAAETRTVRLAGREINGDELDMGRIDAAVRAGTVERWLVHNDDPVTHNFHVHDVQFQVASVDGHEPEPALRGWQDTIYLAPSVEYELVMRFADYPDPATPYMYHCHLLAHEDSGMMGQFVVLSPGQQPRPPAGGHDHD